VIVATLFVYGCGNQVNWGEWSFLQLPSPGDVVTVSNADGTLHGYAAVRHTEHAPASIYREGKAPSAIVVTDWKAAYSG
jgi:hypothetical protein